MHTLTQLVHRQLTHTHTQLTLTRTQLTLTRTLLTLLTQSDSHTTCPHTHNLPPHTTTAGRHGHVYVPDTSCEHDQTDGRVVALLCVVALAFGVRDALRTFQCLLGCKLAVGPLLLLAPW